MAKMKLPKCEHCSKLMVGHLSRTLVAAGAARGQERLEYKVIYLCPERVEPMEPIWVEVHA